MAAASPVSSLIKSRNEAPRREVVRRMLRSPMRYVSGALRNAIGPAITQTSQATVKAHPSKVCTLQECETAS